MRAQGGGAIVSTASIAGIDGYPNLHAYCAAKAGVVNLTRSASIEFAADKIRVNCIAPGGVSTPILGGGDQLQQGGHRRGAGQQPSRCRWPASRRTSPRRRCSWPATPPRFITGHCLVVDGGATAGQIAGAPRAGQERPARNARSPAPRSRCSFIRHARKAEERAIQVLVLFCHPSRESFVGSILTALEAALDGSGHTPRVLDLYAEGFDPVLRPGGLARPPRRRRPTRPRISRRIWPRFRPQRGWC